MKIYVIVCTNSTIASRLFRWLSGYLMERRVRCRVMKYRYEIDLIGQDTLVKFATRNDVDEYVKGRHGKIIYVDEHLVGRYIDLEVAENPHFRKELDRVYYKDGHYESIWRYTVLSENRIEFKTRSGKFLYDGDTDEPSYFKKISEDRWIKIDTIDHHVLIDKEENDN